MLPLICRLVIAAISVGWALIPATATSDTQHGPSKLELPRPAVSAPPRLAELKNNQWLDLGQPAPDPRWGRARGRTWTSRMAFAASLNGAFLFGEGVHAWVNPDNGRYMDDLWFYDIGGHRWVNLYPGMHTQTPPDITINDDGFTALATDSGLMPLPIATMTHGYQAYTWDASAGLFASMPAAARYWRSKLPTVAALMDSHKTQLNTDFASPWLFDPLRGRWQRHRTAGRSPASGYGDVLLYLEHSKTLFFRRRDQVWFYDSAAQSWDNAQPGGPPPPFGIEATAAYDSRRQRVYLGGGLYPITPQGQNPLWIYDAVENTWLDPKPNGDPGGQVFNTNSAMLHYDTAADALLLFRHADNPTGARGIYAYSPDANRWRRVGELPDKLWPLGWRSNGSSGFYYPPLGLHLFHVAGDSRDNGRILAYRYQLQQQ